MTTDPESTIGTEAAVVAQLARANGVLAAGPVEVDEHRHLFIVPRGYDVRDIDTIDVAAGPRRPDSFVTLSVTDSLVAYANRYKGPATLFYAEPDQFRVTGVFDDHTSAEVAGWRGFIAALQLTTTPAWKRWTSAHGRYLDQVAFAELVEDGMTEIATPAGADLLELAQSLTASTKANFRSDHRLANGRVQLTYVEEIDARAGADGQMVIPDRITLVLEPFFGAAPVTVEARLRYRIKDGRLALGVWLVQHLERARDAFDAELAKIEEGTGLRPLWGSP